MPANPKCPACRGRGQWYSPDNGQVVTCDCDKKSPQAINHPTLDQFVQLHQKIEIIYVVDGYCATYLIQDGERIERSVHGETILEAIQKLGASLIEQPPE